MKTKFQKFETKDIFIEAVQWTGQNIGLVTVFCPSSYLSALELLMVPTLVGTMPLQPTDWVIKTTEGYFHTRIDAAFRLEYEEVWDHSRSI